MKITVTSDLHGYFPKTTGGDLLIVAGDLTADHKVESFFEFCSWIDKQDYKKKVVIAGNHDMFFKNYPQVKTINFSFDYLEDSGTEFEGLKIWGSPWSLTFEGINPLCTAFTTDEKGMEHYCSKIPDDVDILVTHGPPWGILDKVKDWYTGKLIHVGSKSLASKVGHMEKPPKLWVFGHIHEGYGIDQPVRGKNCKMVNASHVDRAYDPVNAPINIEL